MTKTKCCIWVLSLSVIFGTRTGWAQDPLDLQVQVQKDQEKQREKEAAIKLQQKEKEEQERQKQQALEEQERQKQEALKVLNKRLENSAVLSKPVFEKLAFRLWSGEAYRINTYHQPTQAQPVNGLKAKLSRVFFQKSHDPDRPLVLESIELLAEDGAGYMISYDKCSEDEHLYIEAFIKLWKKEKYARTWTDVTGKFRVDAVFDGLVDGKVRLIKSDGKLLQLPLEKLSIGDQELIKRETAIPMPSEIAAALTWLANHQLHDGSWSLKNYVSRCTDRTCTGPGSVNADAGATAMSLLPFLAARQTHKNGIYKTKILKAIQWLIRRQQADGNLAKGAEQMMYSHGLATIALCADYGLTGDRQVGLAAQGAVDFIRKAQNTADGGWRYNPGDPGDTSVMGWQLTALKSAQLAGLDVGGASGSAFSGATKWLDSVALHDGTEYSYQPSQSSSNTMTSVGLLCRQYLGAKRDNPMLIGGMRI